MRQNSTIAGQCSEDAVCGRSCTYARPCPAALRFEPIRSRHLLSAMPCTPRGREREARSHRRWAGLAGGGRIWGRGGICALRAKTGSCPNGGHGKGGNKGTQDGKKEQDYKVTALPMPAVRPLFRSLHVKNVAGYRRFYCLFPALEERSG